MIRALVTALTIVFATSTAVDVVAASRGKPASKPPAQHQPARASRTKAHRTVARTRAAKRSASEAVTRLQTSITLARNGEQSARRRYEGQTGSQARNAIRRATLERANLENQLTDAQQRYQTARAAHRRAKDALRVERSGQWQQRASGQTRRTTAGKARKLKIAAQPLGRTGSGQTRPTNAAKGVLKTRSR